MRIVTDPRFWRPTRRVLLRLYDLVPSPLKDRYLEWLYPDWLVLTFSDDHPKMAGRETTVGDLLDMANFEDLIPPCVRK